MPHQPHRILVVEDDAVLLRVLRARLARFGHVEVATTLAQAQILLSADPRGFDVWVLDGHLPDGWGPSLLSWFGERHPEVALPPVCVWSGSPLQEIDYPHHLATHLPKPQLVELIAWLEAAVGPPGRESR